MKTAVIVTTYNRPACLARSLPQIVAAAKEVDAEILVVHDEEYSSLECIDYQWGSRERNESVSHMWLPENRGLACALNIGLSYFLADPTIEAISYFQDDVEVDPLAIAACNAVLGILDGGCLVTGHDAREHRERHDLPCVGEKTDRLKIKLRGRNSCRATHMSALVRDWKGVMPIPSRALGLPSREIRDPVHPEKRGTGSGVDWWIVRDSPNRLPTFCIPGLVRTFAWKKADSTWDNESIAGEDGPLHRNAIAEWEGCK